MGSAEDKECDQKPRNQRFARAEGYDLVRQMVRALGKYWTAKGVLADSQDIFYLEMEELWSFIDGLLPVRTLKGSSHCVKRNLKLTGWLPSRPY